MMGRRKADAVVVAPKRRKSGIPTGNAGEYFVMGELLRRGFDAQLADRNTAGYDLLMGSANEPTLRKVQVKSVRKAPWFVKCSDYQGEMLDRITIFVLIGAEDDARPVRYFITRNRDLADCVHIPKTGRWLSNGYMPPKSVLPYEDRWDTLFTSERPIGPKKGGALK